MNVLEDTTILDELLEGDVLCQITSHLCAIHVTHAVVTRCGQSVPCCPMGAALQRSRIEKRSNVCGHCGKTCAECWTVIKV